MGGFKYSPQDQANYVLQGGGILHAQVETLKNRLITFESKIKLKYRLIPLLTAIFTVILAFVTSSFKETFGISGSTWQAFFLLVLVFLIGSFVYCLLKWLPDKEYNADKFVEDLKTECNKQLTVR